MTKRLGDSDRRAVDLLLDQAVDGGGDGNGGYVVHAQPALGPGVPGVQRVLSLLDLLPEEEPPADLMKRGGAYYSTLATQVIESHHNDLGQVHVVNVRNAGAVPAWPSDWVLELPARVDRGGIHPLPAEPLPPACFGLVSAVKMYELLTVEAAVHGNRDAAYQAMLSITENTGSATPCATISLPPRLTKLLILSGSGGVMNCIADSV